MTSEKYRYGKLDEETTESIMDAKRSANAGNDDDYDDDVLEEPLCSPITGTSTRREEGCKRQLP